MTIVRTEMNRSYRESTRKFYETVEDVVGWRWLSARDLRTCPLCWAMDGRVFKTKTKFGTHPNCRCTMVPVFKGEKKQVTGAAAFAKLNEAQKLAILGPGRLALYNQGAELIDFVELNKSAFGIGRNVRPLSRTTFTPNPRTIVPVNPNGPATPEKTSPDRPTSEPASPGIRPGDPVPKFASAFEATVYMSKRFPGKVFDFDNMALPLVNTTVPELVRVMDKYAFATRKLEYVGTYSVKENIPKGFNGRFSGGEYAHAARDGSLIAFNAGEWFNDTTKLRAAKKRGREIGWSASGEDDAVATHEFGHVVDGHIRHSTDIIGDAAFADGRNEVGSVLFRIFTELRPKRVKGVIDPKRRVSDYAMKNRAELFAESFAFLERRPVSEHPPIVNALGRLLDRINQGVTKSTGPIKEFRELPNDEKEAFRKEFDDFIKSLGLKVKL